MRGIDGGACFIAFPRASNALDAASAIQAALADAPIPVRAGIHTREPLVVAEGGKGVLDTVEHIE